MFRHLGYVAQGTITVRMKIFRAVHMAALNKFISRKATSVEERDYFVRNDIVKITWKEKDKRECVPRAVQSCGTTGSNVRCHCFTVCRWGGNRPTVTLEYDDRNAYLLFMTLTYNRRAAKKRLALNANELKDKLLKQLENGGIFVNDLGDQELAHQSTIAL